MVRLPFNAIKVGGVHVRDYPNQEYQAELCYKALLGTPETFGVPEAFGAWNAPYQSGKEVMAVSE